MTQKDQRGVFDVCVGLAVNKWLHAAHSAAPNMIRDAFLWSPLVPPHMIWCWEIQRLQSLLFELNYDIVNHECAYSIYTFALNWIELDEHIAYDPRYIYALGLQSWTKAKLQNAKIVEKERDEAYHSPMRDLAEAALPLQAAQGYIHCMSLYGTPYVGMDCMLKHCPAGVAASWNAIGMQQDKGSVPLRFGTPRLCSRSCLHHAFDTDANNS